VAAVCSILASLPAQAENQDGVVARPLTSTEAVQRLSREAASEGPPARIEGVVTFSHPVWRLLFIEDGTGGIYCEPTALRDLPEIGHRVIVEGAAASGAFLPILNVHRLQDLGPVPIPAARAVKAAEIWKGKRDGDFVRLTGHVVKTQTWSKPFPLANLHLISDGYPVEVQIIGPAPFDLDDLPGTEVEVTGVFGPRADADGRITSVGLLLAKPEMLRVVKDSQAVLVQLPVTSIPSLWTNGAAREVRLMRLRGAVNLAAGNELYLGQDGNGVNVETPPGFPVSRGEQIEIIAFPVVTGRELKLRLVRLLSRSAGQLSAPVPVQAKELFDWGRYGQVVQLEGEFLHRSPGGLGDLLVMRDGEHSFEVKIRYEAEGAMTKLVTASRLRVAGTLRLQPSGIEASPVARILVGVPEDFTVVAGPPWPLRRTLAVVTALSGGLALGLVALGLAHRRLRASNRRVEEAEHQLRELNEDLERRIESRTTELSASESRFRTLVEGTDVIFWEYDPRSRHCKYISPQAARLGYPLSDWSQPSFWREHLHPEDQSWADAHSEAEIKAARSHRMQYRFLNAQGKTVWFDDIVTTEAHADGTRVVRGVMTDVTERKRAEEDLSIREERLRLATEVTGCGIFDHDLVNGRLHFSPIFNRMVGRPDDAPVTFGQFIAMVHPEDRERLSSAIQAAHDPKGNGAFAHEYRVVLPDGGHRWLAVRSQTFFVSEGDKLKAVRVTGVALDTTDRRKAEDALRESEERFAKAFHGSPAIIAITSFPEGRLLDVNERLLELSGYSREELLGHTSVELGLWERPEERAQLIDRIRRGEKIRGVEFSAISRSGRRHTLISSVEQIVIGGEACLLSINQDITERKEAEEARAKLEIQLRQAQKMEAIGTLAGGIAHDFNNILASVIGNAELALRDVRDKPETAESLKQVLLSSQRAKELVRRILTFSRREECRLTTLRLDVVLAETVQLLRSTLPASLELRTTVASSLPDVRGNSALIQQVLINLATNAAQAIGDRPGRLELELRPHAEPEPASNPPLGLKPGQYARITVRDNGPGIAPGVLDRIFEPFFTTKRTGEGTGLGLSVVHGIVQAHEGVIQVESREGIGTSFEIYLPAADVTAPSGAGPRDASAMNSNGGSGRILLIDDEPALLKVSERVLRQAGYEVRACSTPGEALELFRETPQAYHLIITDYSMPGMSGLDLAAHIRDIRTEIPMLICTGYGAGLTPEKARQVGFREILHKPVELEDLCQAVRSALQREIETSCS
jgi:PAS domain S-box-containing protein